MQGGLSYTVNAKKTHKKNAALIEKGDDILAERPYLSLERARNFMRVALLLGRRNRDSAAKDKTKDGFGAVGAATTTMMYANMKAMKNACKTDPHEDAKVETAIGEDDIIKLIYEAVKVSTKTRDYEEGRQVGDSNVDEECVVHIQLTHAHAPCDLIALLPPPHCRHCWVPRP